MGIGTLGVISWAEQAHTREIAHTMGAVTFSLYALFFSIATRDERRTVFSLDKYADAKFLIATGVSIVVAAEIRKAVRRRTAPHHPITR